MTSDPAALLPRFALVGGAEEVLIRDQRPDDAGRWRAEHRAARHRDRRGRDRWRRRRRGLDARGPDADPLGSTVDSPLQHAAAGECVTDLIVREDEARALRFVVAEFGCELVELLAAVDRLHRL